MTVEMWLAFGFGIAGSVAVEIVKVLISYEKGRFPKRYGKVGFWLTRAGLAAIGGLLVIAYGIESKILAMHIGAATPAILENFAAKPPTMVQTSLPSEQGED